MKRTLYIAGGFTLAFLMPFNLQAQNTQPKDTTMNRTVVVEQEYNPDILDASNVNEDGHWGVAALAAEGQ